MNDIKSLLKSDDCDKTTEALKTYREEFPDDWNGKPMEGIISQLRGDDASFRRIHDEAQAITDKHDEQAIKIQASLLWKKYHSSWKKVVTVAVIGILAAGAVGGAFLLLDNIISARLKWTAETLTSVPRAYDGTRDIHPEQLFPLDPDQPSDKQIDIRKERENTSHLFSNSRKIHPT